MKIDQLAINCSFKIHQKVLRPKVFCPRALLTLHPTMAKYFISTTHRYFSKFFGLLIRFFDVLNEILIAKCHFAKLKGGVEGEARGKLKWRMNEV